MLDLVLRLCNRRSEPTFRLFLLCPSSSGSCPPKFRSCTLPTYSVGCWLPKRKRSRESIASPAVLPIPLGLLLNYSPGRRILIQHAGVLQHIGPLAASSCVAVLEVLPEVICPEKLFAAVALAEFVNFLEMADALFPVLVGGMARRRGPWAATISWELLTAVAACVCLAGAVGAVMEGTVISVQSRAAPAVSAYVKTVLMAFGLVLVLESVSTKRAFVLLLRLVRPIFRSVNRSRSAS